MQSIPLYFPLALGLGLKNWSPITPAPPPKSSSRYTKHSQAKKVRRKQLMQIVAVADCRCSRGYNSLFPNQEHCLLCIDKYYVLGGE